MSSNSSFSDSTAQSYALALYEISKENSELDLVEEKIKNLVISLIIILKDNKTKQMNESYIDVSNINKGVVNYNL